MPVITWGAPSHRSPPLIRSAVSEAEMMHAPPLSLVNYHAYAPRSYYRTLDSSSIVSSEWFRDFLFHLMESDFFSFFFINWWSFAIIAWKMHESWNERHRWLLVQDHWRDRACSPSDDIDISQLSWNETKLELITCNLSLSIKWSEFIRQISLLKAITSSICINTCSPYKSNNFAQN